MCDQISQEILQYAIIEEKLPQIWRLWIATKWTLSWQKYCGKGELFPIKTRQEICWLASLVQDHICSNTNMFLLYLPFCFGQILKEYANANFFRIQSLLCFLFCFSFQNFSNWKNLKNYISRKISFLCVPLCLINSQSKSTC